MLLIDKPWSAHRPKVNNLEGQHLNHHTVGLANHTRSNSILDKSALNQLLAIPPLNCDYALNYAMI